MIHEHGNRLLDKLEQKIGSAALPHILRWIAGFAVLSWGLSLFSPTFLDWIDYDRSAILSGQVWRIFSWIVFPSDTNVIFVLFAMLFMFFLSDALERSWGSFRVNVFVLGTMLCLSLIGLVIPLTGLASILASIFYAAVLVSFATLFPDHIIHLMAIIPIKAKWLGWATVAILLSMVLTSSFILLPVMLAGFVPYLLVFGPLFFHQTKLRSQQNVRRERFQKETSAAGKAFHTCEICSATEISHPERDFRVTADDREICSVCLDLERAAKSGQSSAIS